MIPNTLNKIVADKSDGKDDSGKIRYDLVPVEAEEMIAKILTEGAKNHGEYSWKNVPNGKERYYAALRRHAAEWHKGNKIDEEDFGLPHMMHVAVNAIFIAMLDMEEEKNGRLK